MSWSQKDILNFKPEVDFDNQSFIFPGTEDGERIRINSRLQAPDENPENYMSWLKKSFVDVNNPEKYPIWMKTLLDLWINAVVKYADLPCLGDRKDPNPEDGKSGQFVDHYTFKTYKEIDSLAGRIGSALVSKLQVEVGQKVGIFAGNSWEWTTTSISAGMYNFCLVPMYETLGSEAMRYILQLCELDLIIVDNQRKVEFLLEKVLGRDVDSGEKSEKVHKIKNLVVFEKLSPEICGKLKATGVLYHYLDDLLALQKEDEILPYRKPDEKDICSICFTSGTTGKPKGVMQSHLNHMSLMVAMHCANDGVFVDNSSHLSFMPSAHVYERVVQLSMLSCGGKIGYSCGDPKRLVEDAGILKPTLFCGVPRIWNRFNSAIQTAIKDARTQAISKGIRETDEEILQKMCDEKVFAHFRNLLGGNLSYGASGAAPIRNDILNFLRKAFDVWIVEGYGQTEGTGGATCTLHGDVKSSVGPPLCNLAIKLVSVPEMNYFTENDQGEICTKGYGNTVGYYRNPEKTAELIDEDGWLHTGDVGQWTKEGTLQIIDRAKHIFKTSLGEYIAPEKIEAIYMQHPALAQCFVYGDGLKSKLVGIVVPNPETFGIWANGEAKIDPKLFADLEIQKRLLNELTGLGQKSGLKGFEQIKNFSFVMEPFTPENGLLTPTGKTKRPYCRKHFEELIKGMYERIDD